MNTTFTTIAVTLDVDRENDASRSIWMCLPVKSSRSRCTEPTVFPWGGNGQTRCHRPVRLQGATSSSTRCRCPGGCRRALEIDRVIQAFGEIVEAQIEPDRPVAVQLTQMAAPAVVGTEVYEGAVYLSGAAPLMIRVTSVTVDLHLTPAALD
jgi:hypothetical protein